MAKNFMKKSVFLTGKKNKLIAIFIFILVLSLSLGSVSAFYSIKKTDSFTASARTIFVTESSGGSEKGSITVAPSNTSRFGFFIRSEGRTYGKLNIEFNEKNKLGNCELQLYRLTNGIAEEIFVSEDSKNILFTLDFLHNVSTSIYFYFQFDNKTDYEIIINDFEVIAYITENNSESEDSEIQGSINDFAFTETFVANNLHFYTHNKNTVKVKVRKANGKDAPNKVRLTRYINGTTSEISAKVLDNKGNPVENQDTLDFNIYLPKSSPLRMLQIKNGKAAYLNNIKVMTLVVDNMLSFKADGLASDFVKITRITETAPIMINRLRGAILDAVIYLKLETENSDVIISANSIFCGEFKLTDKKLELGFINSNNIFINNIINGNFANEFPSGNYGQLVFEGNGANVSIIKD